MFSFCSEHKGFVVITPQAVGKLRGKCIYIPGAIFHIFGRLAGVGRSVGRSVAGKHGFVSLVPSNTGTKERRSSTSTTRPACIMKPFTFPCF